MLSLWVAGVIPTRIFCKIQNAAHVHANGIFIFDSRLLFHP
jgi:hypothetical protein